MLEPALPHLRHRIAGTTQTSRLTFGPLRPQPVGLEAYTTLGPETYVCVVACAFGSRVCVFHLGGARRFKVAVRLLLFLLARFCSKWATNAFLFQTLTADVGSTQLRKILLSA